MEEVLRTPSITFLIDDELWDKFNAELRAACHWCTHHHTTTPAEAAKQLQRGESWPRDWVSRKVKNSTRQFGGLFICPAPDCAGHSNSKGERRRRWFCRFCINRHLGVDLKSFFQLDEVHGKWIQVPNLYCWHCRAKTGEAICINCPQRHAKRAKRTSEPQISAMSHQLDGSGVVSMALLAAASDVGFENSNEARGNAADAQSVEENSFASEVQFSQPTPIFIPSPSHHQRGFFAEKVLDDREEPPVSVVPSFIDFLNNCCTPFHTTFEAKRQLLEAGFQQLDECEEWELQPGGRYFFTRNLSSIYAFAIGRKYKPGGGFHAIAAHTDSPCPKLKPATANTNSGFLRLRVHAYGSGLWNTWFDRDLSVAGRVLRRRKNGELSQELVRIRRPILRIPTMAFHLDRSVVSCDGGLKQDLESQLAPVLATQIEAELTCDSESPMQHQHQHQHQQQQQCEGGVHHENGVHHPLLLQVLADELQCDVSEIADFELSIYDTQPACIGGAREEFIFSGRLDNLASSFCALWALLDTCSDPVALLEEDSIRMISLFDNGEAGCEVNGGSGPHIMFQTMMRIARWLARGSKSEGVVERSIRKSFVVSADMAHAIHPDSSSSSSSFSSSSSSAAAATTTATTNVGGVEDQHNQPKLHDGLVVKHNPTQSNATDAVSAFLFTEAAKRNCIPTQRYGVVSEVACCSTIDSVLAAGYGFRIVDCGLPQLSMHSVREMCATQDIDSAFRHFRAFFQDISSLDEQLRADA